MNEISLWRELIPTVDREQVRMKGYFLWIGFLLSRQQLLQGVRFFGANQAMLRIEQNLPARSQKRGEAPITPRVGKGCRGLGLNARPPVRELAHWTTRPHRRPHERH
jgi:hypothetical protein